MTRPDDQLLPPMKWNAWGDPAAAKPLSDGIRALLKQALGVDGDPRCRTAGRARFGCGRRRCRTPTARRSRPSSAPPTASSDDDGRLLRAGGKSTLDLLRRKDTGVQDAPDAVLLPGDEDEVAAILALLRAAEHRGGALRRRHQRRRRPRPDPRRLQGRRVAGPAPARTQLHGLDEVSGEAELGAGLTGPEAENVAWRAWLLARPLPAELPVRHHRRLRGDAVLRPELRGLRPLRRHGPRRPRRHSGRRSRPRPRPGLGGGTRPAAAASSAPRASSA